MRMRLTVTQLRIVLLVTNLLLAAGVFGYAGYSYLSLANRKEDFRAADASKFAFTDKDAGLQQQRSASQLEVVAQWAQPTQAKAAVVGGEGEQKKDTTQKPTDAKIAEGEYPPGPLGEPPQGQDAWEYVCFFLNYSDPLQSLVILQKKAPAPVAAPGAGGAGQTGYRRTQPPRRPPLAGNRPAGARPGQPSDRISFPVGKRQYINQELSLNFMIHSADENLFVYWMPDEKPRKLYALKYVPPSEYYRAPEEGLRPPPEEVAAKEGVSGEEKKLQPFIVFPRELNPDASREKEYQSIFEGGRVGPVLEIEAKAAGSGDSASATASGTGSPSGPAMPPGATQPPKSREEQLQELRKTLKEIPPEARAEVEKAFQKAPPGRTR